MINSYKGDIYLDIDKIKKEIQSFFDIGTLTIVGSGLSCAEGLPGMNAIFLYLQKKIPNSSLSSESLEVWSKISDSLAKGVGLEDALQTNELTSDLEIKIKENIAEFIREKENKVLDEVLNGKRILKLTSYIKTFQILDKGLPIITTNYDRLIELASELAGIRVNTMFVGNFISKFSVKESQHNFYSNMKKAIKKTIRPEYAKKVDLYKPHGCLSWYLIEGEPYSIPYSQKNNCLIITPGVNKYKGGYHAPFDDHRQQANKRIDSADRYVIIGYGFNDDHLETHLTSQLNRKKKFLIVTRSLSENALKLIKENENIISLSESENKDGTLIRWKRNQKKHLLNMNLWDIEELIKEVF